MKAKLGGGHFRMINEKIYTCPGNEALKYFSEDSVLFDTSAVIYLFLKFVVQWVDGQISFLEAKEVALVINFCMCLLKLYSELNIGKISLSRSSTLANEEKAEKYKDLLAQLQLLSILCSKDLVDFSTEPIESQGISIAQVVYVGLHIITALVSLDLLKFPKLCRDYFSLLSHMLEVYPEMIAQLSGEAFAHIMGTLYFGLRFQVNWLPTCHLSYYMYEVSTYGT